MFQVLTELKSCSRSQGRQTFNGSGPGFSNYDHTKNVFNIKKSNKQKYRKSLFFSTLLLNSYGYKAGVSCEISCSWRWTAARSSRCKEWSPRRLLVSGRYCLGDRPAHKQRQSPQRDFVMSGERWGRQGEWTAGRTLLWQVREGRGLVFKHTIDLLLDWK